MHRHRPDPEKSQRSGKFLQRLEFSIAAISAAEHIRLCFNFLQIGWDTTRRIQCIGTEPIRKNLNDPENSCNAQNFPSPPLVRRSISVCVFLQIGYDTTRRIQCIGTDPVRKSLNDPENSCIASNFPSPPLGRPQASDSVGLTFLEI